MSDNRHDDLFETDESELTGLRAEDSLLFETPRSSALIELSTLAAKHADDQIQAEPSSVDLLAVTDAGDATPLLLPVSSPASARPRQRLVTLLAIAAMTMGLATASLAYTLARTPAAETAPVTWSTRADPLAVPQPIDVPAPILMPVPAVAIAVAEPAPAPEPVIEPAAPPVVEPTPAAKPRPRPRPRVTVEPPCGDEIECLLAGVDSSPKPALVETPAPDPGLPARLDTFVISQTMKKAQSRAASCDDRFGGGGNVKLKLTVDGDGKVTAASVVSAPNPELGACVADAARTQRFPRTHTGATFAWLFPYR